MKELRSLTSKDLFKVTTILNKIGISQLKGIFKSEDIMKLASENKGKSAEELNSIVGFNMVMDIVGIIISNLDKAEKEIYSFLASLTNSTTKEIEELPIADFTDLVVAVIKKEDFKDFFVRASSLLK